MDNGYTRVGPSSRTLFKEVEPVAPYPKINPQQQQYEDNSREEGEKYSEKDEPLRRRFKAMRRLIEKLQESQQIGRINFMTANHELRSQGLAIIEEELLTQLLLLKIPLASIDELFQQLQHAPPETAMVEGLKFSPTNQLFSISAEGLSEYNLVLSNLSIRTSSHDSDLNDALAQEGRFVAEKDRLRLIFRQNQDGNTSGNVVLLDVNVQIGAVEIDEDGRRVILYQRPDQSFGLYSDKQIDLSI